MPNPLEFSSGPLTNDDRRLANSSPLEFSSSPAGLDLAGERPSPGGLRPPQMDMSQFTIGAANQQLQRLNNTPLFAPRPEGPTGTMYYSPSTGDMMVNGFTFNQRNASAALASREAANQPRQQFTLPDTAGDWRELSRAEYDSYINSIENPTYGRRMGEAWEHAWRGVADVGVGALSAVDELDGSLDNEWAARTRADILQGYENNAPFMMQMRDVSNVDEALTYTSQMLIQGVPWLIETIATMAAGGVIGGMVSGGVGAPAGAVEAFVAKEGLRQATRQILQRNLANGARAFQQATARAGGASVSRQTVIQQAVRNGEASADDVNRFFDFAERAYHNSSRAAGGSGIGGFGGAGSIVGAGASNYMTGVGDIRNTVADAGADPASADAIANIWGMAIPYALVETAGDLLLTQPLTRALSGTPSGIASAAGPLRQRAVSTLRGGGLNAVAEGAQESAQYVIGQQAVAGATGNPIDIEPIDLMEAGVAGAIGGFGVGALTGVLDPTNRDPNRLGLPPPRIDQPTNTGPNNPMIPGVLRTEETGLRDYARDDLGEEEAMMRDYAREDMGPEEQLMRNNALQNQGEYQMSGTPARTYAPTPQEIAQLQELAVSGTPEQQQAARNALAAFSGSDEVDTDAAYRASSNIGPGAISNPNIPTPYVDDGIAEQLTGLRQEIEQSQAQRPVDTYSYPGGLDSNPIDSDEYNDLNLPPEIIQQLTQVRDEVVPTDPESAEFKTKYPELSAFLEANKTKQAYVSPSEAAAGPRVARPLPVTNRNAPVQDTNPIMPDGLPKYGAHRLKKPVDRNGNPTGSDGLKGRTEADPLSLIEEAKKKAKAQAEAKKIEDEKTAKREAAAAVRKEEAPAKKAAKQAEADAKMREMANRTEADKGTKYPDDTPMSDAETAFMAEKTLSRRIIDRSNELQKDGMSEADATKQAAKEVITQRDALRSKGVTEQPKINKLKAKKEVKGPTKAEDQARYDELFKEQMLEHARDIPQEHIDEFNEIAKRLGKPTTSRKKLQEADDYAMEPEDGEDMSIPEMASIRKSLEAGAASVNENTKPDEPTTEEPVLTPLQKTLHKQLLKAAEEQGKLLRREVDARQKASGILTQFDTTKNPQKWLFVDNKKVARTDVVALIHWMDHQKANAGSDQAKLARFDEAIRKAWRENRANPKDFAEWVTSKYNIDEARQWLASDMPDAVPAVRGPTKAALEAFDKDNDKFVKAVSDNGPSNPTTEEVELSSKRWLHGSPDSNIKKIKPTGVGQLVYITRRGNIASSYATKNEKSLGILKPNNPTVYPLRINGILKVYHSWDAVDASKAKKDGYVGWTVITKDDPIGATGAVFSADALSPWFQTDDKFIAARGAREVSPGRPPTAATFVLRRVLRQDPNFTFRSIHPATRARSMAVFEEIKAAQRIAGEEVFTTIKQAVDSLSNIKKTLTKDDEGKIVWAANEEYGIGKFDGPKIRFKDAKKLVRQIQARIFHSSRFSSVHVFENKADLIARAESETMFMPNGAEITIKRFIDGVIARHKRENPSAALLTDAEIIDKLDFDYRAGVLPYYNALFVFYDKFTTGTRREFMEVMEHEYIVHKGLRAIFANDQEREVFLTSFGRIPGVEEMRLAFIGRHRQYATDSRLDQLEELLAFHSMEGPLALEKLLTAPEGMDPDTRRTLWEDFKDMVMRFLKDIFEFTTPVDKAMDEFVSELRQHAIMGTSGNFNFIAYKHAMGATPEQVAEFEREMEFNSKFTKAVSASTPEDTIELLAGTRTNPRRPYEPTNAYDDLIKTFKSNLPLMEKLKEAGSRNVGTSIKEGLKKVAHNLVTMDQMALESKLIEKMLEIMDNTIKVARNLMQTRQDARGYSHKSTKTAFYRQLWGDKEPGSTDEELDAYNRMAIIATNHLLSQLSDSVIRTAPRLLERHPDGTYTVNRFVFEGLLKEGTLTKQQFLDGVEQFSVDTDGEVTSNGVAKLSKKMIELAYDKIYVPETRHMAESALQVLISSTMMLSQKNAEGVRQLIRDSGFKPADQAFVDEALQRMFKLYADIAFEDYTTKTRDQKAAQQDKARSVLVELMRSFHEPLKVKDWTDKDAKRPEKGPRNANDAFKWREQDAPEKDVAKYKDQIAWFLQPDPTTGNPSRLDRISKLGVNDEQQYDMLGVFQSLLNAEAMAHEEENAVIQSVMGGYVEMTRNGKWRVAVEVYEADGKTRANVPAYLHAVLPVTYAESQREAIAMQADLYEQLKGTHKIIEDGEEKLITFDVSMSRAPGTKIMSDAPKIKEFLNVMKLVPGLDAKINVEDMTRIANLIESSAKRKRFGLQRAGTPGADLDIIGNNNETMTRRAWQAAKLQEAWMLDSVLTDNKNRFGDWDHLAKLQRNFDIANRGAPEGQPVPITFVRSNDAVIVAELELLRYANQLRHMARHSIKRPTVNVRTTKGEKKLKIVGEAEVHIEHAQALQESLEKNELELNLNDLISKTGPLRQMGVVMQLGTIAAGIMNMFTPITHLPWVLMARHGETGYGEAHTFAEVIQGIMVAVTQVMAFWKGLTDTIQLKALLDEAEKGNNKTGLTLDELRDMYLATLNGDLTPQQTYSMTGGTESSIRNLLIRNLSELFLKPFSAMEAATRRVAWLTTYRLAKQRYIRAGISEAVLNDPKSDEHKKLLSDVARVVKQTQGNYTNVNRPRAFRGDYAQYVLQYKMFPLISTLMINNLPMAQKGAVLGVIFLLSGLKGEPFADDFADIYDTLLQKLGFRHDSVELQLTQFFEDILPGSSKWIMHGGIDAVAFGGTMSSRLSMGDNIPLTGMFREGADIGREILNAFGPAFASNTDSLEWAWVATDFTMQLMGLKPDVTSWEELIRKFPQGQVRAVGEASLMAATGQITDPRGRLVSDEVDAFNIFSRFLGFYPLEASNANNAVRLDRMHTGYMKAVRARFILAYANHYRNGNDDGMDSITEAVRDWNEAAEMTGQEDMMIRNFRSAAVRAGRAASSTTIERTSQGAPDYSLIDELAVILNADEESDN